MAPQSIVRAQVEERLNLIAFDPARTLPFSHGCLKARASGREPDCRRGLEAGSANLNVCGCRWSYGRLGKTGVGPFDDSYFLSFSACAGAK